MLSIDLKPGAKYNDEAVLVNLKEKLSRTRGILKEKFEEILQSSQTKEEILDELSESLILADVGLELTERIIGSIRQKGKKTDSFPAIKRLLEEEALALLSRFPLDHSFNTSSSVVMVVGVNGGGKTTSLAKLARYFQAEGESVLMVAADTFRAAASEQLVHWGKKLGVPVIKGQYGADPASVIFDAIQSFKTRQCDHLLVDTAGRIHTNINLMNELEKIKRIVSREIPDIPREVLLVLDASIGQNALVQAQEFLKFSGLTGIFLTKLDGTARGGSVLSVVDTLHLPIQFIGTGEGEEDIFPFSPEEFVKALLS